MPITHYGCRQPAVPEDLTIPLPGHIATLRVPDLYREAGLDQLAAGRVDLNQQLRSMAGFGHLPAALMIDTLFVSNGTPSLPPGYMATIIDGVRSAGGLCIADEVQAGFARSGRHFWGYEHHGRIPDLVTMGKPIGSGFPLGVVATRREILESFVGETGMFSTFGGNPLAAAAGLAVLEVIENEGLQDNALRTGAYLRAGFAR